MFKNEVETIKQRQRKNFRHAIRFMSLAMLASFPTVYHIVSGQPFPIEKTWYSQALMWSNNILNVCALVYFYKVYMDTRKIECLKIVEEYKNKDQENSLPELPQSDKEIFMFYKPEQEKEL